MPPCVRAPPPHAQPSRRFPAPGARVASSVGPYGAILHDGSEYRGRYGRTHRQLVDFHRERLEILAATGPDLLAIETIPDVDEAAALVEALADHPGAPGLDELLGDG